MDMGRMTTMGLGYWERIVTRRQKVFFQEGLLHALRRLGPSLVRKGVRMESDWKQPTFVEVGMVYENM